MSKDFFRLPDHGLIRKAKRPRELNFSRVTLQGAMYHQDATDSAS